MCLSTIDDQPSPRGAWSRSLSRREFSVALGLTTPASESNASARKQTGWRGNSEGSQRTVGLSGSGCGRLGYRTARGAGHACRTGPLPLPSTVRSRIELGKTRAALVRAGEQLAYVDSYLASWQFSPRSIPSPVEVAVAEVRREVAWADGKVTASPGQLIAEAAMDYTVGHVSTAAYGYLEAKGASLPGFVPNDILAAQAGICGQAAHTFAASVAEFGLQVRSVQFF